MPAPQDIPPACRESAAYRVGEALRALPRSLWGDTPAMRAAGSTYLPLHEGETEGSTEYRRRLASSFLYPAHPRAVRNLVGKVFSRQVQLGKDVPDQIRAWCEDVDLRGNNLHNFARAVETDVWLDGVGFVFVDYAATDGAAASREDDAAAGRRPWLVRYRAGDLINWRTAHIAGKLRLTLAVFRETGIVAGGEFDEAPVTRCRAYIRTPEGVTYELWEQRADADWVNTEPRRSLVVGGAPATEIPVVAVYADPDDVGKFGAAAPPLAGLAWLNVRDWQKQSDLDNIEHTANVPVTVWPGMSSDDVKALPWGPTVAIGTPSDCKPAYLEHSGKAIGELKASIADNRELMRLLSLEPMVPKSGTQTATGEAIRGAEAHSQLLAAALCLQDGLEQALRLMAQWARLGDDAGGSVIVNTKFQLTQADAADVQALNQMRLDREITRETRWKEMQRREVLGDDFDPELEAEALKEEAANDLAGAGRAEALARRVVELVKNGEDPDAALAQAEAEVHGDAAAA